MFYSWLSGWECQSLQTEISISITVEWIVMAFCIDINPQRQNLIDFDES